MMKEYFKNIDYENNLYNYDNFYIIKTTFVMLGKKNTNVFLIK